MNIDKYLLKTIRFNPQNSHPLPNLEAKTYKTSSSVRTLTKSNKTFIPYWTYPSLGKNPLKLNYLWIPWLKYFLLKFLGEKKRNHIIQKIVSLLTKTYKNFILEGLLSKNQHEIQILQSWFDKIHKSWKIVTSSLC